MTQDGKYEPALDREMLLAQFGGDEEILREIAELFIEDAPRQLSEIQEAMARRDGDALARSAHSIKGAIGNFTESDAYDLALKLELLGRDKEFSRAEAVYGDLEKALDQLMSELETVLRETES